MSSQKSHINIGRNHTDAVDQTPDDDDGDGGGRLFSRPDS